jgi:hypothetical protein
LYELLLTVLQSVGQAANEGTEKLVVCAVLDVMVAMLLFPDDPAVPHTTLITAAPGC